MAVIWVDEFENERMDSSIGITFREQHKVGQAERAIKPAVHQHLEGKLVLLQEKLCRSQ